MTFLSGLLTELLQRCRRLRKEIAEVGYPAPEASDYQSFLAHSLGEAEVRVGELLQDPGLEIPSLAQNYLYEYKRLAERIYQYEWGPALALVRYSQRDHIATLIVHRVAREIGYPYPPPLCVALSVGHYYTLPRHNLIYIPVGEPFHLLGLADLYHEIAHILLTRDSDHFLRPLIRAIDEHFNSEIRRVDQERRSPDYRDELQRYRGLWRGHWVLEFASDMISTYWVGAAYGWSNLRVCTNLSSDPFGESSSHPADDARNRVICSMLRKIGNSQAADEVQTYWDELVGLIGHTRPQEYELRYPSSLLARLEDLVHQACQNSNLVVYTTSDRGRDDLHIGDLLNESWQRFNSDAEEFTQWEEAQIERLQAQLGLS